MSGFEAVRKLEGCQALRSLLTSFLLNEMKSAPACHKEASARRILPFMFSLHGVLSSLSPVYQPANLFMRFRSKGGTAALSGTFFFFLLNSSVCWESSG